MATLTDQYHLDARPDRIDLRDRPYEPPLQSLAPEYPPTSYVTKYFATYKSLVLNQGKEGACTGFGLAAVINLLNHQRGRPYDVSTRMLYVMARRHDEWPRENYSGSSCRGAIKGWYAMGVCRESHWPYRSRIVDLTIPRAKQARENTLGAYYRLRHRISDFHTALSSISVWFLYGDCFNRAAPPPAVPITSHKAKGG